MTELGELDLTSNNLAAPDVLAAEIAEDLRAALEQFNNIAEELSGEDD